MKEIKLGDIAVSITDGKHGDCENAERSGFYFVSCKDIHDGIIDYTNARQITQRDFEDTHRRTKLEPNDILITNSGTIGRMALVKEQEETKHTTFQKSVAIVKPDKEQVLPRYLYYALLNCVKEFINRSNGSAQKNLLLGTMRNFTFNIHEDFEDQERIAAILSAYDDLIENNKQQIKLLEEMAQRLYKEWFVDLHFPGYEDVPVVDSVPKGWRKLPLSEIADVVMGQSPKSEFYNDNHEGLPFHQGVPNITPHVCRHTFCSKMARKGMNPKNLQYIMGHSEYSVTMDTYTELGFDDALEDFRKVLGIEEAKTRAKTRAVR